MAQETESVTTTLTQMTKIIVFLIDSSNIKNNNAQLDYTLLFLKVKNQNLFYQTY